MAVKTSDCWSMYNSLIFNHMKRTFERYTYTCVKGV